MTLIHDATPASHSSTAQAEPPPRARRRLVTKRARRGSVGVIVLLLVWEFISRTGLVDPFLCLRLRRSSSTWYGWRDRMPCPPTRCG